MKTTLLRILYFVFTTILFALGFYRNQWQVVDTEEILYRRDVSEIFVIGRLVKSRQDGIFSAGGLLGIGDVLDYSVEGKVIKNQYDKYDKGKGFSEYWTYKSHPGFQGIAYGVFDSLTDFTSARNLSIFRLSVSILLSLLLSGFCFWIGMEIGWFASISVALFTLFSKWLAILGGNIYWSLWVFYLPLTFLSFYIKKIDRSHGNAPNYMAIAIILSLTKILFSGFEFITSGLLIVAVPFVYYAVLNGWGWRLFFRRMMSVGIGLVSSVIVGLIILGAQIKSVLSNIEDVLEYIVFAWTKRTYSYEEILGDSSRTSESVVGKTLSVVGDYLNGYAFSISRHLSTESSLIKDLADGKYLFLILFFALATALFFILCSSEKMTKTYQTGNALVTTTWFSILGPLSWLIVFRDHAALHTHLDFMVWQMPFTLYGFALIGFVISILMRFRSS